MRSWIATTGVALAILTAWIGCRWTERHRLAAEVEDQEAKLRARGEPLDLASFVEVGVPADQNAFDALLALYRRFEEDERTLPENAFDPRRWSTADREVMVRYFAEHDSFGADIAEALEKPRYAAPEVDRAALAAAGKLSSSDPERQRIDIEATLRDVVPIELSTWLLTAVQVNAEHSDRGATVRRDLDSMMALAERQRMPFTHDLVLRIVLATKALGALSMALEARSHVPSAWAEWLPRIAALPPSPDPLRTLRADRAQALHWIEHAPPEWLSEFLTRTNEAQARLERGDASLEAYFEPSFVASFREVAAHASFVRLALGAAFFAEREQRWPAEIAELSELLAASGGLPQDKLSRSIEMKVAGNEIRLALLPRPDDPESEIAIRMSL